MSNGRRRKPGYEMIYAAQNRRRLSTTIFDVCYPALVALVVVEVSRHTGMIHEDQIDWLRILPSSLTW